MRDEANACYFLPHPSSLILSLLRSRYQSRRAHSTAHRIRDRRGGQPQSILTGHTGLIMDVAFAPEGRLLATACSTCFIRLRSGIANSHQNKPSSAAAADVHEITMQLWQPHGGSAFTGRPPTTDFASPPQKAGAPGSSVVPVALNAGFRGYDGEIRGGQTGYH